MEQSSGSGSGGSSGRSSKVSSGPLSGMNSSMTTELSSALHLDVNSIQHEFSQSSMNVDPHFYNAVVSECVWDCIATSNFGITVNYILCYINFHLFRQSSKM